jgi:protease-4
MQKGNLLLAIQNGFWLIEPSAVNAFVPIILSLQKGDLSALKSEQETPSAFFIAADGAITFSAKGAHAFSSAPSGSIMVIPVSGAIMKQDNCGTMGTASIVSLLNQAKANPNISGAIIKTDSPGGTVAGTEEFSRAVTEFAAVKPIVSYIEDLAASAAYWGISGSTEIYAGNQTSRIGSIGTMLSFADMQPMLEKQGVVFHEVYAPDSSQKNEDFIQARKGNYDLVKQTLGAINDVFKQAVIDNRGTKLNKKDTLTGKVFMMQDAISNGLIDGQKSFDEVVTRVQELVNQQSSNNQSKNNTMKVKSMWVAMTTFLATAFTGFKAEETVLTEEHLEKMNAELDTLATVKADAQKAIDDLAAANKTIETLTSEKTTLVNEKATLTAQVEKLNGKSAGATNINKIVDDTTTAEDDADDFTSETDNDVKAMRAKLGYK